MKFTTLVVGAVAIAALSGCGSDEPDVDVPSSGDVTSSDSPGKVTGDASFLLTTAADQLSKQLVNATGYLIDGSTMTFLFDAPRPEDGGIGSCQIATTVLDGIAPGEIDTLGLKYTDAELACADLLS